MADWLPDPIAPDVIALDARFGPLSSLIARLSDLPVEKLLVYLVEQVDASLLQALVEQFHVSGLEGGALATTDAARRALIKRSVAMHRKKGTPWSIKEALKTVGVAPLDIEERLPVIRYDGTINHAGGELYRAYNWAQFRVTASLEDSQSISAENTALVVAAINEWKPLRSQLVDVQYRLGATEAVAAVDVPSVTSAILEQDDLHLWGRRLYDGAVSFNQGVLRHFGGAFDFSGGVDYSGYTAAGERFDAGRETDEMAGSVLLADTQSRGALFDGFGDYGGGLDFGETPPVAQDMPLPVVMTRLRRYDGRHAFAAHSYSGGRLHDGGFSYFGNIPYSGDVVTLLEVQ